MRGIEKLTAPKLACLSKPGRYGDGGGLYLQITKRLTKGWIFRYQRGGLEQYISQYQRCRTSDTNLTIAVSLRRFLGASFSDIFRTYMVDCKIRIHSETPVSPRQEFLANVEDEVGRAIRDNIGIELGRMENAISLFSKFVPKSLISWIMTRTQGTNVFYSNPGIINEDFRFFGRTELVIRECSFVLFLVDSFLRAT
ncbi:MAG: Arm DNA-binding domain-containing protein [Azoarcus sp.]|jgi:hypothetical protein|nr:Arm DNA-binding domain-containing protein [Azoarcus sp.]